MEEVGTTGFLNTGPGRIYPYEYRRKADQYYVKSIEIVGFVDGLNKEEIVEELKLSKDKCSML